MFVPDQQVYVHKKSLNSSWNTVAGMATASSNKLQLLKAGTFHINKVQLRTVEIEKRESLSFCLCLL